MDKLGTIDVVDAGLVTIATPPKHPCPKCGKGMEDCNTYEQTMAHLDFRRCCMSNCRTKADWITGVPVIIEE